MSLFANESAMQEWLSKELENSDGLADLITNTEYLEDFVPSGLEESKILDSFKECLSALYINEIISEDKNISLDKPDSLRPDFLLYSPEEEGIVIVELKNLSVPSREAGTELSAYSGEVKTYVPFLSDGDLYYVLVSTVWPVLLRHYIFHEIFWQQKNIICLEPVASDGVIRLQIKDIAGLLEADTNLKISDQHITGYQLCLYDDNLYSKNPDKSRLDQHIPQMKAALSVISTEGNRQKSHGFAFLWKDNWEMSLAPYSISIFNIAPFQSIERFLHDIDDLASLTEIQNKFIKLVQELEPSGHGKSLSRITASGSKFLKGFCNPHMEGFHTWDVLSEIMLSRADLIAFQGWGMFGDLFNEHLIKEYSSGNINLSITCPEIGLRVVNDLIDPDYNFIYLYNIQTVEDEDINE